MTSVTSHLRLNPISRFPLIMCNISTSIKIHSQFPDDGSYHLFKIGRLGMVRIIRATMGVDLRGNTGDTVNMHI